MELKTIEAYNFNELKEDIQDKVINKYFSNDYFDTRQYEDIYSFEEYKYLDDNYISFDLNYNHISYAPKSLTYSDLRLLKEDILKEIIRYKPFKSDKFNKLCLIELLEFLLKNAYYDSPNFNNRCYYTSYTQSLNNDLILDNCIFHLDKKGLKEELSYNKIYNHYNMNDIEVYIEILNMIIHNLFYSKLQSLLTIINNDYENSISFEYVEELCNSNNYLFDIEGNYF